MAEFHYFHHDTPDDYALDRMVLKAAHDAGIRMLLLNTYYHRAGFNAPLLPTQARFHTKVCYFIPFT